MKKLQLFGLMLIFSIALFTTGCSNTETTSPPKQTSVSKEGDKASDEVQAIINDCAAKNCATYAAGVLDPILKLPSDGYNTYIGDAVPTGYLFIDTVSATKTVICHMYSIGESGTGSGNAYHATGCVTVMGQTYSFEYSQEVFIPGHGNMPAGGSATLSPGCHC